MFNKILVQIVNMMIDMGSSDLQDQDIRKPRYRSKQLETAMNAPIDLPELKKRIKNV